MKNPELGTVHEQRTVAPSFHRAVFAAVIGAAVLTYTIAVVMGLISPGRKIDSVTLAIIVLGLLGIVGLLDPHAFDRLKRVKMTGFEVELLERVRERQVKQENQLEDISLILPVLLPDAERRYLINFADERTAGYKGSHELRAALRRLRSIGLVRMRPKQYVAFIKDDLVVDLSDYVELTDLGKRWVQRIKQLEKAELLEET